MIRLYTYILTIVLAAVLATDLSARTIPFCLRPKVVSPQLEILDREVYKSIGTAGELEAIKKLNKMAISLKQPYYEAVSAYYFAHYYRWNHNADSLGIWVRSLAALPKSKPFKILEYEGRKMLVESYCIDGLLNNAWNEIERMNDGLAIPPCLMTEVIMRNSLAIIYFYLQYGNETEQVMQHIVAKFTNSSDFIPCQTTYLLLARFALDRHQTDEAYFYLEKVRENLNKLENESMTYSRIKYNDLKWYYYAYFMQYCLQKQDIRAAKEVLEKMQNEITPASYIATRILYYNALADYSAVTGQVENALDTWKHETGLLGVNSKFSVLLYRRMADLLMKHGWYKDAYDTYLNVIQLQDSFAQNYNVQKINQFRTEYQAVQNELQNERLSLKSRSLYWLIAVLSFFVVLLIILIFVNRRLKGVLLELRQKAERSDRLKSMFLANMNHEIRTPLNAVAGFSQLLVDETDPEISGQYVNIIKGNNDLLLNLLNDILDISRIESDTITFSCSKVYLPQIIDELVEIARLQTPRSVSVLKGTAPELYIYTDRNRLVQILSNLISNAIKHTSEGSITIGYELLDPEFVRFQVTDTGKGISEELQKKIFARFMQAMEAHSKGVGLGLALCKGFVEHLGGKIGVESEIGKGSTFWFTLPARLPENY